MLIKRKELEKVLSPRIETDRLILRRFKESDIDMQYDILHDDRLATYIHFPDLTKEEELECIKNGYIANRRLNKDGTYSGVEYYSKRKMKFEM